MSSAGRAGSTVGAPERLRAIRVALERFEHVEAALPGVLLAMTAELPLVSGILYDGRRGRLRVFTYHDRGAPPPVVLRAEANARAAYALLAGPIPDPEKVPEPTRIPLDLPADRAAAGRDELQEETSFFTLPLVTQAGAIFGCFQVEGARALEERDLSFVSEVTRELASAIDRRAFRPSRRQH